MNQEELIAKLHKFMRVACGDDPEPADDRVEEYHPKRDERGRWMKKPPVLKIEPINRKFKRNQGVSVTGRNYWASICKDGHCWSSTYNICFADMGDYKWAAGKQGEMAVIGLRINTGYHKRTTPWPDEIEVAYLHYLANVSPYKDAFISKDGKKMWEDKYVFFTPDIAGNMLCAAMCAVRMIVEYPWIPVVWNELVKNDVDPDIAYIHAYQITVSDDGKVNIKFTASHSSWAGGTFSKQAALNFIKHNPVGIKDKNYNDYRQYNGMCYLFGDNFPEYVPWQGAANSFLFSSLNSVYNNSKDELKKGNINPFNGGGGQAVRIEKFCANWSRLLNAEYIRLLLEKENA